MAVPDDARVATETTISDLMGRDASARYDFFIMAAADEVDGLDV